MLHGRLGWCTAPLQGETWQPQSFLSSAELPPLVQQLETYQHDFETANSMLTSCRRAFPQTRVSLAGTDGLSLAQQATLVQNATVLVQVHGASMANWLFLPEVKVFC